MIARLNRLFAKTEVRQHRRRPRLFGEGTFLAGIEDIDEASRPSSTPAPTRYSFIGQAPLLQGSGPPQTRTRPPHRRRQRLRWQLHQRSSASSSANAVEHAVGSSRLRRRQPPPAARPAGLHRQCIRTSPRCAPVRPRRNAADGRAARDEARPRRYGVGRRRREDRPARPPGGRARRRRHQGRPDRRPTNTTAYVESRRACRSSCAAAAGHPRAILRGHGSSMRSAAASSTAATSSSTPIPEAMTLKALMACRPPLEYISGRGIGVASWLNG